MDPAISEADSFSEFIRPIRAGDEQTPQLGGTAQGRRMQLARAVDCVADDLDLDLAVA